MKQAKSSFKLRILLQKLVSATLVICLIFGLSAETIAFASDILLSTQITETVEYGPDTPTYPDTEAYTETPSRSLEELKTLEGVYVNENGLVTRVNRDIADLTREELELLLTNGAGLSSSGGHPGLEASGLTASEFEFSAQLHGGENVFSRELAALNRNVEIDGLDSTEYATLKTLICSGYTYRQARAAAVAAPMLGVTTSELCSAKIVELTDGEGGASALSIEADESAEYHAAAIKMGVPYNVIKSYVESHTEANILSIANAFSAAVQSAYASGTIAELQAGIADEHVSEVATTSDETPAVIYAPEKVLSDPFGYKSSGSLDVNFINGEFIFTETDLYIPGTNGLDLNITRQYISDFSNAATPYIVSTGYHDNEVTLQLVYDLYVWDENTETYSLVSDFSGYSIVDSTMNSQFKQVIGTYKTSQYFAAVAAKAYYADYAAGQWGAYNDKDEFVIIMLVPSIQPVGNFETAFVPIDINYDYYVDEFGLGHGWRFGFSAIESYLVDLEGSPNAERLILADGRVIDIDANGDLVYELDDIQLSGNSFGYPGAYQTLLYADGKREYFDSNGRNIAIVDRYGNEIKIEYTTVNDGKTVTEMRITDTVGNIVVFKDVPVDLGEADYLQIPGASEYAGRYTSMKTLSLNGEVIRTYYSYEQSRTSISSGYTTTVKYITAIKDEAEQHTFYSSSILNTKYNCLVSSPAANDSYIYSNNLNQIQYPNGMCYEIKTTGSSNRREVLGYSGYQSQNSLFGTGYYYETDSGTYYQSRTDYSIGDFSAQSPPADEYSHYVCSESSMKYKLYDGGSARWPSYRTYYTYNYKQQLVKSETIVYTGPTEEEFVQGDTSKVSEVGTRSETTFTYDDDLPFPITASTKIYEPGNTTSYMVQNYSYTYDAKGNLLSKTLPNGQTITYTYSADYNLPLTTTYKQNADTTIVEQNTPTTDNKSIASTTVTSNGTAVAKTVYTYDAKGRVTAIDTYSSATEYTTQQLTYGNQAQVTQITISGIKTADDTDAAATPNNTAGTIVEKTTYNARGWPISYTDGNGNVTSVTYDALGRITLVSYPDGGTDQYVYDTANNTVTYTDANENTFTYKYDPFGNLIEVYDNASSQALLSYEYDSRGNKVLETIHSSNSAKDQITYYEYDYADRLIEVGMKSSTGTKTPLESYTYNAALGKTTHTVYGSTNAPDSVETVYVDNMGNTIHTGRMLNDTEYIDTYTYDYLGNCVEYKSAYTTSIGGTYTAKYTYDHAGNLLTTTDALNNTVTNTYDWQGNALRYTDALGNITQYTYDKLGRLTKTISPIDSTKDHTVKYYYDPVGNLIQQLTSSGTTVGNFDTVEYTYDSMNRLTEVTTPIDATFTYFTTYFYDQMGNVLSARFGNVRVTSTDNTEMVITSPSVTTYTHDRFGNVLTETNALSKTETYTYDLNGNILTKQDRNGVLTQYTYDNRRRLLSEEVGSGSAAITLAYTYALNGLLLSEARDNDIVTYVYDAMGRLVAEANGTMRKAYTYNIGDLCTSFEIGTSLTVPLASSIYTYDALGRLTRVVSTQSVTASYTYDANSNPTKVSYGVLGQQVYTYNAGNLIESILTTCAGTQYTFNYVYDYAGRQHIYEDGSELTLYEYDALGQLICEERLSTPSSTGYEREYTYDPRGNRLSMVADGVTTTYSYNGANQLLTSTTGDVSRTYTYDDAGNLLTEAVGETVAAQYFYTADHKQRGVVADGTAIEYTYYPNGLRKTKNTRDTSTGSIVNSTQYVWNGNDLVLENDGSVINRYLYGLGLYASVSATGATTVTPSYYYYDAHGNVVRITSGSTVTHAYLYDAFGNQLNTSTTDTNPFRYCGEYYDTETGNYYLRARYYDPGVGRFTQQDTHWNTANMIYGDTMQKLNVTVDAEGMESFNAIPQLLAIRQAGNLYGYAANNPVAYIDPSGLDAIYVSHRKWGEGGLPVVGHAFLYFESGGNWYFTEFDGKTKRDAKVYLRQELSKESIDQYLKSLSNATIVYIEGDFSASLEIAQRYDGTNYSGYHFFKNNCLDYVQEVMHAGQCSSYWVEKQMQTSKQIVPQFFAVEMMTGIPMTVWLKLLWFGAFGTSGGG